MATYLRIHSSFRISIFYVISLPILWSTSPWRSKSPGVAWDLGQSFTSPPVSLCLQADCNLSVSFAEETFQKPNFDRCNLLSHHRRMTWRPSLFPAADCLSIWDRTKPAVSGFSVVLGHAGLFPGMRFLNLTSVSPLLLHPNQRDNKQLKQKVQLSITLILEIIPCVVRSRTSRAHDNEYFSICVLPCLNFPSRATFRNWLFIDSSGSKRNNIYHSPKPTMWVIICRGPKWLSNLMDNWKT